MAFTFINDPTDLNSNSYCSVAEADDYHETVHPTQKALWVALSSADKERALVAATRAIDNQFTWLAPSYVSNADQFLQFPRKQLYKQGKNAVAWDWAMGIPELGSSDNNWFAGDIYPDFLKNATAELARGLFTGTTDITQFNSQDKIASVKAGSVEVAFKDDAKSVGDGPIPAQVVDMLNRWADLTKPTLVNSSAGFANVTLRRG